MGGVAKAISKVFGGGSKPAAAELYDKVTAPTQATSQETFDEQKNSERKGRKRLGSKKLQIPTQGQVGLGQVPTHRQTGLGPSGGTGLGTGV